MDIDLQSSRVTFGEIVYEPGGRFGPRVQHDLQLVFVHRGEARVEIDGEWSLIPAGSVAALKPGRREFFEFSADEQTHHSWCAIRLAGEGHGEAGSLADLPFMAPIDTFQDRLLRIGLDLLPETGTRADALLVQVGVAVLAGFLRVAGGSEDERGAPPVAVEKACREIRRHYSRQTDLEKLSSVAGVTPSHLIRLFRRHVGATPIQFLWEVRLREGMRLLRESGLSISEIAFRCGFQNPFHFSRQVKKASGAPPREYRLRSWDVPKR